jgi:hypothetical protein
MKAVVYFNDDRRIIHLIDNVTEVGDDFVVGDRTLRGINTNVVTIVAVDDEILPEVDLSDPKKPQFLPTGVEDNDKKSYLKKPTMDDLGRELALEKLSKVQIQSTITSLGKELATTKVELMKLKGGMV